MNDKGPALTMSGGLGVLKLSMRCFLIPGLCYRGGRQRWEKMMIDDKLMQAIRARVEAASPGPWKSYIEGRDHLGGSNFIMTGEGDGRGTDIELLGATEADQDFIAHARQDLPLLLEEVGRLRGPPVAETPTILDGTSNQAVVKMPGRRFPGVVIQGDSLHTLREDIAEVARSLNSGEGSAAASMISGVLEGLDGLLAHYEEVLRRAGYDLPYSPG